MECPWCGTTFVRRRKDQGFCSRRCSKANSAAVWRANNHAARVDYSRAYYAANKPQYAAYNAARQRANPGAMRAYRAAWESRNPEKTKECKRQWEAKNAAYMAEKAARRRSRTRVLLSDGARFMLREIYLFRDAVSAATGVKHHVDHVIPLNHPKICGLHTPCNLAVVPWYVNLSKGNTFEVQP